MPEILFTTVEESLAYLKTSKCAPLSRIDGLGEQVYAVCPPGFSRYIDIYGDADLIRWANAYRRSEFVTACREAAGWEHFDDEGEAPSGEFGWHAPCGTHENSWIGPMPEDQKEANHVEA